MATKILRRKDYEAVRPQSFAQKLVNWATCWLRPDIQTVRKIMNALELEQFLQGLPRNIQVWVRWHLSGILDALVKLTGFTEVDLSRAEGQLHRGSARAN